MDAKQAFWFWSERQQQLRRALRDRSHHAHAIALFLQQHAMLHAAALAPGTPWSFADAATAGLASQQLRAIPRGHSQSIVWLLWHSARTEDVAINILLGNQPQVLDAQDWYSRLGISERDIGTAMTDAQVADVSDRLDVAAVQDYRQAVGRQTRAIVEEIRADVLRRRVEPERLQLVKDEGALVADAYGIADYWGRHAKANLLLMPATRHPLTHLKEALRIHARLVRPAAE